MSLVSTFPAGIELAAAFRERPLDPDFVLPGLVAGTVGALVSPGATGKSIWALEIAAAVAGGGDVLDAGANSGPSWTRIPEQAGQRFQGKLDSPKS